MTNFPLTDIHGLVAGALDNGSATPADLSASPAPAVDGWREDGEKLRDEVVAAASALGTYDDFGEPDTCPHCGPKSPENYNAARKRLYWALHAFRDHPWKMAAPSSSPAQAAQGEALTEALDKADAAADQLVTHLGGSEASIFLRDNTWLVTVKRVGGATPPAGEGREAPSVKEAAEAIGRAIIGKSMTAGQLADAISSAGAALAAARREG